MRALALVMMLTFGLVGCGDEVTTSGVAGSGAKCGNVTCNGDEYCCDADCGMCVPTQVACTETCDGE